MILSQQAKENLKYANYDPEEVERMLSLGEYGNLYDALTGDVIRAATLDEAIQSHESGPEGYFELDGIDVYVLP